MRPTLRCVLTGSLGMALTACAMTETRSPPPLRTSMPGGTRVFLPDVLGTPLAILAPELPVGAIATGERARFEIAFSIDLRGAVVESSMHSTTRPDLVDAMLAQHRQWVYAVATRAGGPCRVQRFRGVQTIDVQRVGDKLVADGVPARVVEVLSGMNAQKVDTGGVTIVNYRSVMGSIIYPRAAVLAGVEGSLSMIVVFGTDGAVKDAFPVNLAHEPYGFAQTALRAVRRLKADPSPPNDFTACVPVDFRLR